MSGDYAYCCGPAPDDGKPRSGCTWPYTDCYENGPAPLPPPCDKAVPSFHSDDVTSACFGTAVAEVRDTNGQWHARCRTHTDDFAWSPERVRPLPAPSPGDGSDG